MPYQNSSLHKVDFLRQLLVHQSEFASNLDDFEQTIELFRWGPRKRGERRPRVWLCLKRFLICFLAPLPRGVLGEGPDCRKSKVWGRFRPGSGG